MQGTFTTTTISGAFDANINIVASRTSGVSPCTVVFQAYTSTITGLDSNEVFRRCGYYWDFDDPASGTFSLTTRNQSKNTIVGGPIVAHTFEVADGSGSVNFAVRVRVKDHLGSEYLQETTVTVQAQNDFYSGANTIAVSNTETPGNWHLNTYTGRQVPAGYTEASSLGAVDWDNVDGKRILLKRGDDFTGETSPNNEIRMLMGQSNVMISWFGNIADARPIVEDIRLGVKSSGSSAFDPTDAQIIANGWSENVTVDGLRSRAVRYCQSPRHFGIHNVDCDQTGGGGGGIWEAVSLGDWAWRGLVNGALVPMPYGVYCSDSVFKGNSAPKQASPNNRPSVNLSALNGGFPTYMGVIGSVFEHVNEHNIRTQGGQTMAIHDTDCLGNMDQDAKHCLTLRGVGWFDAGDVSALTRASASNNPTSRIDYPNLPKSKWMVVQRCTMDANTVTDAGVAGREISIAPQNAPSDELVSIVMVRDTVFNNSVDGINQNVFLLGQEMTSTEQTYTTSPAGQTRTDFVHDLNGLVGLGPYFVDQTGETAFVLPVPTAPR